MDRESHVEISKSTTITLPENPTVAEVMDALRNCPPNGLVKTGRKPFIAMLRTLVIEAAEDRSNDR